MPQHKRFRVTVQIELEVGASDDASDLGGVIYNAEAKATQRALADMSIKVGEITSIFLKRLS